MTATFTLTGRILDKSKHPVKRLAMILTATPISTLDGTANEVYGITPQLMTDEDGYICRNVGNKTPSDDPGVTLVVGAQYTLRPVSGLYFDKVTFNAPDAGTTLDLADIIPDPPDLPDTWSTTTTALAQSITSGDEATLTAAEAYTDSHVPTIASASTTAQGIVELATNTEATTGTDTSRAVTPAGLKAAIDALVAGAPGALDTLNEIAVQLGSDETAAGNLTALVSAIRNLTDSTFVTALSAAYAALGGDVVTRTTSGALTLGSTNAVDATTGPLAVTLAAAPTKGIRTPVYKSDATTNTVTITLKLRGSGSTSTLTLSTLNQTFLLQSRADGTYDVLSDHRTETALAATYAALSTPVRTATTRLRAVAVGDSTAAGGLQDPFGVTVQVGNAYAFPDAPAIGAERAGMQSWFTHACLRSGGRLLNVHNAGVHSDTSAGILARFATDVLAYQPDIALISGGVHNDLNNSVAVATIRANWASMIRQCIAAGIMPVLVTAYPENGTQTVAQGIRRHNAWLKVLAAGRDATYPDIRGLIVVDPYAAVVDVASTTGAWTAAYSSDGTHPNTAGAIVAGDKVLADLAGLLRGNIAAGPFAAVDSALISINAVANPLMLNDINSDGKADSWSATGTGTTWSLVTDAAVPGKAQQAVVASSTGSFFSTITIDGTNYAVGDRLKWSGWVKVTAAAGSLNWYAQIGNLGGTAKNVTPINQTVGMDYGWVYHECEYVVPASATQLRAGYYWVAGTGTLLVAAQSVINLSKL